MILDFQHFYAFEKQHHEKLISILLKLFEHKLCQPKNMENSGLDQITLSNSCSNGKQVLIIYRNSLVDFHEFFKSWNFPTPWPETTKIADLKKFLDQRIQNRFPHQGFVSQLLLTPDAKYIIPRFYSTLRKTCARQVDSQMFDWLREQKPGIFKLGEKPTINVILADFVDIQDNNFSKIVVDLNMTLKIHDTDQKWIICFLIYYFIDFVLYFNITFSFPKKQVFLYIAFILYELRFFRVSNKCFTNEYSCFSFLASPS